ncbi:uncharacterized protein LODBEIA_P51490 [Lodderomyces beijingensis]|uniref:Uncharacterized protein n=1 Tax=Lodderomyces beijingensis TaxID=1775926 RepID=A0ABP0ZUQ0_9ASCO
MSFNNGKPYAADVPVTDMDESDEDIIHPNHHDETYNSRAPIRNHENFLRGLDYENDNDGNNARQKHGFISKYFTSVLGGKPNRSNDYELVSHSDSAETPPDQDWRVDDDEYYEPPIDVSEHRLKLLERKVKNRTIIGGVTLAAVAIVFLVLYLTKSNLPINTKGVDGNGGHRMIFTNSTHDFYKTTIVISLDGFHPHYVSPQDTPTLHNMMVNDYGAPYMIPSFPSSTFPNHWTLVTGLYPSEHGIVGNTFWDPKLQKQFINTDPKVGGLDPDFWQGGEPIWQTAKNQGLKSAIHMWPGSEVPHVGPDVDFDKFNGSELLSAKVDRVMGWIDRDISQRPELILTYVPTVDEFGHKFGISGSNLTESLVYVDNFIALMKLELHKRHLDDLVNLIILSDHGMAPTSNDRLLYLDDFVNLNKIEHIDGWPLFGLRPSKDNNVEELYNEIVANFAKLDQELTKNYHIYKMEDIPQRLQFGGQLDAHRFNYRLAPIWIFPDVGYSITTHQQMKDNDFDYKPKGVHGYDNTHLLMRAIFIADGPYFKSRLGNKKVKPFANTEVYNIICDTLDLVPAANNGTLSTQDIFDAHLPEAWSDDLDFPNLPFEVEHIVRNNATYDQLYRKGDRKSLQNAKENPTPSEALKSEASTITQLVTEALPKPSDFQATTETTTAAQQQQQPTGINTSTSVATTTKLPHKGFGEIFNDIMEEIEDGTERIGDWIHDFIDDIF